MTPAERKAAERARKAALGLAQLQLWAPPALHQAIRDAAAGITTAAGIPSGGDKPTAGMDRRG